MTTLGQGVGVRAHYPSIHLNFKIMILMFTLIMYGVSELAMSQNVKMARIGGKSLGFTKK